MTVSVHVNPDTHVVEVCVGVRGQGEGTLDVALNMVVALEAVDRLHRFKQLVQSKMMTRGPLNWTVSTAELLMME